MIIFSLFLLTVLITLIRKMPINKKQLYIYSIKYPLILLFFYLFYEYVQIQNNSSYYYSSSYAYGANIASGVFAFIIAVILNFILLTLKKNNKFQPKYKILLSAVIVIFFSFGVYNYIKSEILKDQIRNSEKVTKSKDINEDATDVVVLSVYQMKQQLPIMDSINKIEFYDVQYLDSIKSVVFYYKDINADKTKIDSKVIDLAKEDWRANLLKTAKESENSNPFKKAKINMVYKISDKFDKELFTVNILNSEY